MEKITDYLTRILACENLPDVFNTLADVLLHETMAEGAVIYTVDKHEKFYIPYLFFGNVKNTEKDMRKNFQEGVVGYAIRTGKVYSTKNTDTEKNLYENPAATASSLAAPIKYNGDIFFAVEICAEKKDVFLPQHVQLLKELVAYVTPLIKLYTKHNLLEYRMQLAHTLNAILSVVPYAENGQAQFEETMRILAQSGLFLNAAVFVLDQETRTLLPRTTLDYSVEKKYNEVFKVGEGAVGRVFKTRKAIYLRDTKQKNPFISPNDIFCENTTETSFIAEPIFGNGEPVGVLRLLFMRATPEFFFEAHEFSKELSNIISRFFGAHRKRGITTQNDFYKHENTFPLNEFLKEAIASAPSQKILESVMDVVEKEVIRIVLAQNQYNKRKTAEALGLNRVTLDKKIMQHGLFNV
ncbi:MAG: hypothetical protein LDLANPLL_00163 [Turneriella sp.]|nr:hypothetical protein [Turneriella sp.]